MSERYWESTRPGAGRRAPRADARSGAVRRSLAGEWRFRLSPTAAGTGSAFVDDDFDDSGWDAMRVPSHWVLEPFTPLAGGPARSMRGTPEGPLYTNTAYPIPLDPPHVPEENPTGDYRIVFDAPDGWDAAVLRFEGVDSCAKVWLNGRELGWSSGSRLPFEFDAPLRPGRNVLAVRVHRWSAGTYLEDQDMWWLPGIFRDVEILERPVHGIDDHHVHADYDPSTGLGMLRVDAVTSDPAGAVVEVPELGIRTTAGATARVAVEPWSAEHPRLYRGTLRSAGEVVELAIGFRRVEVVDGVLLANGAPLVFRGVNRHEHHPETGRTLDLETMRHDVVAMKRANVDAVRTSHYPPHPDFLRLCDELGLWVVLECDLETHGFIFDGWERNPPALPEWRDALLDRIRRTVERDKNHPSIAVWSMANESGTGPAFSAMREWLRDRDPSRPVLYERDPSYRDSDFYSLMYPSLDLLDEIGRRVEPRPDGISDAEDERRRALPFLLVEYAHAMGNGPGSLSEYREIMERHDRICGGFVWEWIDHGFTAERDGTTFVMTGDDVVNYEPRGGRFTLHGLVFSDRTPTPGLVELAKAYEPLAISVNDRIRIRNRRHGASTGDLAFAWEVADAAGSRVGGVLEAPILAPGEAVTRAIPDAAVSALAAATGDAVLTVEARLSAGTPWAPAGHVVAWGQGEPVPAPRAPAPTGVAAVAAAGVPSSGPDEVAVGSGVFDAASGRLVRLGELELDGPRLDLHRAPTENDHGQGDLNDIAAVWRATGMDRMLHRTDHLEHGDGWLTVRGRTGPSSHPHGVAWTMRWRDDRRDLVLDVAVDFVGPWGDTPYQHRDIWVPRLGLLLGLPGGYERATWWGRGPGETYADSYAGSRIDVYSRSIDELQTPYPVPQENGNHVHTRWLTLEGPGLPTLRVDAAPHVDFTARRWTSLDLERAAHPHELRDTGRVWLNLDHAQQGIGSASVGPALPERYRIPRVPTAWTVRLGLR